VDTAQPTEQVLVITLIVKLAVMATLSTMLVRFGWFRRILLTEKRDWPERLIFTAGWGVPVTIGVLVRILLDYKSADLTLSGTFLAGLIAGPYAGALVGLMAGIPPLFIAEWGALPFAIGCGFAGGGLRELCPKEQIWRFSPFFVTQLHKSLWNLFGRLSVDWQMLLVTPPIGLEIIRQAIGLQWPHAIFHLTPTSSWLWFLSLLAAVLAVAIPIKIWNSARIEHRLAEQEKLLMAARVEALANQINPHFLFNTLTSISSLIRSRPETARVLMVKLSGLLRRLLRSQDQFVPLREELEAVDEYLEIEKVRFGPALVVAKQLDPTTLELMVPSMILQPLVENSIKHGLARKVGHGTITIRTALRNGRLSIEIIDDGVGLPDERQGTSKARGIGLRNVQERLRVIYGSEFAMTLEHVPGDGTVARIGLPEMLMMERAR
jgi:two-component system LytT family sensor kinase